MAIEWKPPEKKRRLWQDSVINTIIATSAEEAFQILAASVNFETEDDEGPDDFEPVSADKMWALCLEDPADIAAHLNAMASAGVQLSSVRVEASCTADKHAAEGFNRFKLKARAEDWAMLPAQFLGSTEY